MVNSNFLLESYEDKISNYSQIGGIELATIRGGTGDGTHIAWFNTGSGLRFKVVIDYGLDIADAFINQYGLAWISPFGPVVSGMYIHSVLKKQYYNVGGLLTTYGNKGEDMGAWDAQISRYPATIESVLQPNPLRGEYAMSICGKILQTTPSGDYIELRRTISATLGKSKISIKDTVINLGALRIPYLFSYQCNFGYPLVDDDTHLVFQGAPIALDVDAEDGQEKDHLLNLIDLDADRRGFSECGLRNDKLGFEVSLKYKKNQFPILKTWQSFKKGGYMIGLNPCADRQNECDNNPELFFLESMEERSYSLDIDIVHKK